LERAGSLYPNIPSRLLPLDFYPLVKSFLKKNRPEKVLIYESEVWPSLLRACGKLGIPVFFISGKVSEKAFRKLLRFRAFLKPLFENVVFLARSVPDAERAEKLGFGSVKVVGDLKLDVNRPERAAPLILEKPRPVILWGSTHTGEEDIAVKVHAELKEEFPDLLTVIAPRHVGRVKELRLPGRTLLRSSSVTVPSTVEFYVVDTVGELPALYAHAGVAVIGGSFVPGIGGHNPVEALVWKKPVVVGPYSDHFSHIVEMLKIPVRRAEELPNFLKEALKGEITSDLSYNLWTASRGVAERILEIIGEKVVVEQA
ncbi:MAG: glycosyltransferase N-terminal domain-containing protein, partial [Desulfurobacteriaceae bacterium]